MAPQNTAFFIASLAVLAVIGGFVFVLFIKPALQPPSPPQLPLTQESEEKVLPEPLAGAEEIDVSRWKTYRIDKYGFEARYPEEWEYYVESEKAPHQVNFLDPDLPQLSVDYPSFRPGVIAVQAEIFPTEEVIDDYLRQKQEEGGERIIIGGAHEGWLTRPSPGSITVRFKKGLMGYDIATLFLNKVDEEEQDRLRQIFFQFLQAFKAVPSSSSS